MAELLTGKALEEVMERKTKMRREAYDRRAAQENKEEVELDQKNTQLISKTSILLEN